MKGADHFFSVLCNANPSVATSCLMLAVIVLLPSAFILLVRSKLLYQELALFMEVTRLLPREIQDRIEVLRIQMRKETIWHKIVAFLSELPLASDQRLKCRLERLDGALQLLRKLRLVKFTFRNELSRDGKQKVRYGLIAQELREVLPEAVEENAQGYLQVDYSCLVALLLQSVIELDEKLEPKAID